jgi:methyl-accepting chemotaxis protein
MAVRRLQETALKITGWVGSPQSIVIHTLAFVGSFAAVAFGVLSFDRMLLVLTTVVSLEAIYLSIFIQMTINVQRESLEEVEHDIDEIQEDIDEIQEDVDEIQEDVGELAEDVEEMSEEERDDEARKSQQKLTLEQIHTGLQQLMKDVEQLQKKG